MSSDLGNLAYPKFNGHQTRGTLFPGDVQIKRKRLCKEFEALRLPEHSDKSGAELALVEAGVGETESQAVIRQSRTVRADFMSGLLQKGILTPANTPEALRSLKGP